MPGHARIKDVFRDGNIELDERCGYVGGHKASLAVERLAAQQDPARRVHAVLV